MRGVPWLVLAKKGVADFHPPGKFRAGRDRGKPDRASLRYIDTGQAD
jgi:hypothetical protein